MLNLLRRFRRAVQTVGWAVVAGVSVTVGCGLAAVVVVVALFNEAIGPESGYRGGASVVVIENTGPYVLRGRTGPGTYTPSVSGPDFIDLRGLTPVLARVAAIDRSEVAFAYGDRVRSTLRVAATADLMAVLGARPMIGRVLAERDFQPAAPRVAVLSEPVFARDFAADAAVLGATVRLDDVPYTVVGVVPKGVLASLEKRQSVIDEPQSDRYVLTALRDDDPGVAFRRERRDVPWFRRVVAQVQPGVGLDRVRAAVAGLGRRLQKEHADTNRGRAFAVARLDAWHVSELAWLLAALAVAGILVFVVACTNAAMLVLADAVRRRGQTAIRLALGASRGTIVRHALLRAFGVMVPATAVGFVVAYTALGWLAPMSATRSTLGRLLVAPSVLLAAALAILAVAALTGAVAARVTTNQNLAGALRSGALGSGASGRRRSARLIATVQLAAAAALVCPSALLLRSMHNALNVDLGFDAAHCLVMRVRLPPAHFPDGPTHRAFYERALARVTAVPGVAAAGVTVAAPLTGSALLVTGVSVETPEGGRLPLDRINAQRVTPGYFEALNMRLLRGRFFSGADAAGGARLAIVDERFAAEQMRRADAMTTRLWYAGAPVTVVGVVRGVHAEGPTERSVPTLYLLESFAQPVAFGHVIVRTHGDPARIVESATQAVRQIANTACVDDARTTSALLSAVLTSRRRMLWLLGGCAAIVVVLAFLSVVAAVAQFLASERRGMALRMALGAGRRHVALVIYRHIGWVVAVGMTAGAATGLALARTLASQMFGLGVADPTTVSIALALLAVGCLAPGVAAVVQVSRLDPARELRAD